MQKLTRSTINMLAAFALIASLFTALSIARATGEEKFPTGKYAAGPFIVSFESDGKMSVSRDGEIMVEGVYSLDKDQITFTDKRGPMACVDAGPGKFQWKFDGKALTFKLIEDPCGGRASALTGQPLVKQDK